MFPVQLLLERASAKLTDLTVILNMMIPRSTTPIEAAISSNNRLFYIYLVLVILVAIFTFLVWKSGNKVQDSIRYDADARIGEAKAEAAKANQHADELEAGNITLRTELEKSVAASRSKRVELEREQQKTAKAQEEAASAQLALKKYVDDIAEKAKPRELDNSLFLNYLKGKPKGTVEIWYKSEDMEAYLFASQIKSLLGPGDGDGAGWQVSELRPIPSGRGNPRIDPNAPAEVRYGSFTGLTLIANHQSQIGEITPGGVLLFALALRKDSAHIVMDEDFDTSLPDNHFIIIVGQKR